MQNLSALSREELVGELLSSRVTARIAPPTRVADVEETYLTPRQPTDGQRREKLVIRKLLVARELLMRDLQAQLHTGPVMSSPNSLRDWLRLHCAGLEHEVFIVLYLDTNHRLIDAVEMFRGTLTQTAVYPRELVKGALVRNAAAIAMAHNHPSGSVEPSRHDEFLTQSIQSAMALVDVRVIDHFIVGGDTVLSFAEVGLL